MLFLIFITCFFPAQSRKSLDYGSALIYTTVFPANLPSLHYPIEVL